MTRVAALLRLASPALPIGAFAWSSGLEAAIEAGLVHDAATSEAWLDGGLALGFARWEGPVVWRLLQAAGNPASDPAFARWDARFIASRETRELRQETLALGSGLMKLLAALGHAPDPARSFPAAWARAARAWEVDAPDAVQAYAYLQIENQLAVLAKALPLGQVACQRLLAALIPALDAAAADAMRRADDALVSALPGLALLSAAHETQYSRLFRS